jgi:PAS domain S-box-containing protein
MPPINGNVMSTDGSNCAGRAPSRAGLHRRQRRGSNLPASTKPGKRQDSMTAGESEALTSFTLGEQTNGPFRGLIDVLPVAVYVTDAEGRLAYFNAAAVKLSGRVPELGSDQWCVTWRIFLPDGTLLPHDQCPMAVALRGGEVPGGIECIAERPDGSRFWFTASPAVLRDREGRITGSINLLQDITDRKNAEIEASERFQAIVETTPECVKIVAADGTLLHMNSAGLGMVGASSPDAVIGRNVYELIAPEDRGRFREFNERVCQGQKGTLEFDIIGLNGARCSMETHAAPLRHTDGTTVHLAITRNATERREAERSARLLSSIVDSSDDAIISKGIDGVITSWNKSAERLFGYTAEEAIGQTVAALLVPDHRQEEEPDILARLRKGQRVDHFETMRRRKDGSLVDISLTISPVKDQHGRIVGASKVARDITQRKRYEQRVVEQAHLLDVTGDAILVRDGQDRILYWNRAAGEMYGFTGEEALGKISHNLLRTEFPEPLPEILKKLLKHGHWSGELKHTCRDGSRIVTLSRWVTERDETGEVIRILESNNDITERVRVQEEVRRANQDFEQFAFSASHDLQEPLRTIKIYSELLAQRLGPMVEGESAEFLDFLRSAATRMELLMRDLLTYTQVTRIAAPVEDVDVRQALAEVLANLGGAITESGATVTSGPLPALRAHGTQVRQLFQNLVGNAIKYRSEDRAPAVHITADRQDGSWLFTVRDNGIGIKPEFKEQIFGLFSRLHNDDGYAGTGIGLALCQRIVERYHGRIWVDSEPGRGSAFHFVLPA